jgi:hypothetical protein
MPRQSGFMAQVEAVLGMVGSIAIMLGFIKALERL